jgi:tRNA1(Val) A37 N6-methylase TrmN6
MQIRDRIKDFRRVPASQLKPNPKNWRTHPKEQADALRGVLAEVGIADACIARELPDGSLMLVDGHLRTETLGVELVPVLVLDVTEEESDKLLATLDPLAALAGRNDQLLEELIANIDTENESLQKMLDDLLGQEIATDEDEGEPTESAGTGGSGKLAERFGIVPFSVFNAREGWWQDRKQRWISIGIKSELGRKDPNNPSFGRAFGNAAEWHQSLEKGVLFKGLSGQIPDYYKQKREAEQKLGRTLDNEEFEKNHLVIHDVGSSSGTSVFDPVLCEIAYRWFCPSGGRILDPFAGGSVRGIVAAKLERNYVGHELRAEQVAENERQRGTILANNPFQPQWITGDSRNVDKTCDGQQFDFVFSCPPYADLEVYSDDPADLSNMAYPDFIAAYREIIAKSCGLLRDNRFACFVVGDIRDKKGNYRNFVGDTVQAFIDAGLRLYNEAILITAAASLAIRVGRQFEKSRKLGKTHQNVLVFVKGDGREATNACGECEFGLPDVAADLGEVIENDS